MALIKPKLETHGNNGVQNPTPTPTYAPKTEYFPSNTQSVAPTSYELSSDDEDILLTIEEEENIQNSNKTVVQEEIKAQNTEEADISDEEILSDTEIKASAISMLEGILFSVQTGLVAQDNSDGWISEWFDAFKEANGIDLTQSTVESAIKKQEEIINELKETLEDGGDFEARWEELTGVKYDEEKILKYQQKTTENKFVQMGLNKVNSFCDSLAKDAQYDTQATYDKFVEFYGEEKGQEEFLKAITKGINSNFSSGLGTITNAEFNNDGNIILYDENNNPFEIGAVSDISPDNLTYLYSDKFKDEQINSYLENVEKTTGINYQESLAQLGEISNEALGEANAVNNVLNEYIQSQEGFIDTVAGIAQIGGMALMGIGAIVSAFNPPVGGVIMKTGQGMAVAGTFGDEAVEAFDTATNNQSFKEDKAHYQEIAKEAVTDIALYASGYAIGGVADDFGQFLMSKSGSRFASMVGEIGVDASLSLMSDLIITGEVDFTGEGMSQVLGLITAIVGGKYANRGVDMDLTTVKPQTQTPKMSFNPETGELNAPRVRSEAEVVKLNYTEAGDNVGIALKNTALSTNEKIDLWEYEVWDIESNADYSNLQPLVAPEAKKIMQLNASIREDILCKTSDENYDYTKLLTKGELEEIRIIDEEFLKLPKTTTSCMQYRGEHIAVQSYWGQKISTLQEGDIFEIPGYAFTTDRKAYAHRNYGGECGFTDPDLDIELQKYAIRYHILCPEGTILAKGRSRMGQEFTMQKDSKFELLIKKIDDTNPLLVDLYVNHIPDKLGAKFAQINPTLDTDFSSVDFKNLTPEQKVQIQDCAVELASIYDTEIKGIQETYYEIFSNAKEVTARGKSPKSTLEKIIAKQENGELAEITFEQAAKLIGDGYGIRVQMPSLTKAQSDTIIQRTLARTGKTQAQFQKLIDDGKFDELLADSDFRATFEKLKEARSRDVVESLIQGIKSKQITPANGKDDYFNNYGSEITSYLTNGQLLKIDEAYFKTYGEHLTFVNKTPVEIPNDSMDMSPEAASITKQTNTQKAEKPSGYTDAQFNISTNHTDKNNPLSDMELQLRGEEVHKVAQVEHIPYDIRQGKITATNPKYSQYYEVLKGMSLESYAKYNEYLKATYAWATLKELGLATDTQKPKLEVELSYGDVKYLQEAGVDVNLAGKKLTDVELEKITLEGLAKYKKN